MANVQDDMEAVLPRLTGAVAPSVSTQPATQTEAADQFALLRRCQGREAGAFEELVRRFHPRVAAVIRGILRHSNDCDDIAQQVFAKFHFESAVSTWIYKIAVNECYDHLRKLRVRKATILAISQRMKRRGSRT